jgi:hypothetical protein
MQEEKPYHKSGGTKKPLDAISFKVLYVSRYRLLPAFVRLETVMKAAKRYLSPRNLRSHLNLR